MSTDFRSVLTEKVFSRKWIGLFVFALVFSTHLLSPRVTSYDSRSSIPLILSMLKERNTDLNEYVDIIPKAHHYTLIKVKDDYYSVYPLGTCILALPLVAAARTILTDDFMLGKVPRIEHSAASILVALSALFVFLFAREFTDTGTALLAVIIFAFCTPAWSTASRALWQHTGSMLMLSMTMYILAVSERRRELIIWAGFFLAFSYLCRPTNSLAVIFLSLYVLLNYREFFLRFCFMALPVAIPFLVSNWIIYDAILPPYYRPGFLGMSPVPLEGFFGNIFSPSRGLFIFSPVLVLSLYGASIYLRCKPRNSLAVHISIMIVFHWIVISLLTHMWWGGHSYGPRFFSDMMPFFIYLMLPALQFERLGSGIKRTIYVALVVFLISYSAFVHFLGATQKSVWLWNGEPQNIDTHLSRLWDWKDSQILRGVKLLFH